MWPDGEAEPGRASSGSEVVIMDERMLALANASTPSQINVTGSNLVHVGPKFVSVNQTVHNREVVKGRFLGRELISPKKSTKLRCSIMVFVCWAVVVASGFSFYLVQYIFLQQTRLDLDLPLPKYLWSVLKSTTRAERLVCAAATIFLLVCVVLIIVYVTGGGDEKENDTHDHDDWNISRNKWLAEKWETLETTKEFEPLGLVVIQHTVSSECFTFKNCAAEMRILQHYFLKSFEYDIPYNFLIGNDGRVYEGRGWGKVGAHTRYYNRCALGIGFIGDYREEMPAHTSVTELQVRRTFMLLQYGVSQGYLDPNYQILAAKDIQKTASPGSNLYNELVTWKHFNNGSDYRNKTCEQMYTQKRWYNIGSAT